MALDLAALSSSLAWWEGWGYASLATVTLGCIGESVCEFTDWLPETLKSRVGRASALVLIFGLAIEGIAQINANSASGQIIAVLDDEAGHLGATVDNLGTLVKDKEDEAAVQIEKIQALAADEKTNNDAVIKELTGDEARLAKARDDALTAAQDSRTALAQMTAALNAERAVQAQIDRAITPRNLDPQKMVDTVTRLAPYQNTRFDLLVAEDNDAELLVGELGETLLWAGWDWKPAPNLGDITLTIPNRPSVALKLVRGIHVTIAESKRDSLSPAIVALVTALKDCGIDADAEADRDDQIDKRFDKDIVHILVGTRN